MAFCVNCGQALVEGAKFCTNCGQTVIPHKANNTIRHTVYDGEIHKCPNCGEVLDSFVSKCPACDFEIRDAKATISLQQFYWELNKSNSIDEKALMIRNFPIPNSKEDIMEFMILASSNIGNASDYRLSIAWQSKIEQAYQKAKIVLSNEKDFYHIQNIYDKTLDKMETDRKNHNIRRFGSLLSDIAPVLPNIILAAGWIISIFVLIIFFISSEDYGQYQLFLTLDLIGGAIFIPLTSRCKSALPKLIISLGLILSIIVLIFLSKPERNLLVLVIDVICSIIIFARILKQPT